MPHDISRLGKLLNAPALIEYECTQGEPSARIGLTFPAQLIVRTFPLNLNVTRASSSTVVNCSPSALSATRVQSCSFGEPCVTRPPFTSKEAFFSNQTIARRTCLLVHEPDWSCYQLAYPHPAQWRFNNKYELNRIANIRFTQPNPINTRLGTRNFTYAIRLTTNAQYLSAMPKIRNGKVYCGWTYK